MVKRECESTTKSQIIGVVAQKVEQSVKNLCRWFDSRPEYRKKNKKYFTKCLADQNNLHIFVRQTTGVRKCDGGLTPTQKEKVL